MAGINLTTGALKAILEGENLPKPIVLQIMNIKKIQSEQKNVERYRLQMSDGMYFQPCMLATQMNDKINSNELDRYCIVAVDKWTCSTIHERKIIIVINLTVVKPGSAVGTALGNPTQLDLVKVEETPSVPLQNQAAPTGTHQVSSSFSKPEVKPFNSTTFGGPAAGNQQPLYNAPAGQMPSVPPPPRGLPMQSISNSGARPPSMLVGGTARAPPTGGGAFYGSAPPPSRPGLNTSISSPLSQRNIFPIESLNPFQDKWTIRARVTSKPSIRTWNNSKGEGRVFNVDLVDESGEIRACAFNEVADRFHSAFEMNKVYYISRGKLKPANKKFSSIKNDYELTLNQDTVVEECHDAAPTLPSMSFNFTPIAEIEVLPIDSIIDVIGVCRSAGEVQTVTTKSTNKKLSKRDIMLQDKSGKTVACTLWGNDAEGFNGENNPVVAVKGCKLQEFNGGRTVSVLFSSIVVINPDIPESYELKGWFDNVGKHQEASSISETKGGMQTPFLSLGQTKELDLGTKEKPDYFSCKATVCFIRKENCLYQACPTPECNKKVTVDGMGNYMCEKCNKSSPNFKYRMILSVHVMDYSGSIWLSCFQDTASQILGGRSSQELGELKEQDEAAFDQVFQSAYFKKYIFKVRAKMDTFNDEKRLKFYCMSVSPVNYAQETKRCIEDIRQLMANTSL